MNKIDLRQGDCLDLMKDIPDGSIDVIITDPPYGYSFMGKDWDKAVPSVEIWQECLRVLKPGAFACVMSAPRSDVQNAMISRLMEAGFRLDFTPIYWTYACLSEDTEVLTGRGWKRWGQLHKYDVIGVYDETSDTLQYESPTAWNTYRVSEDMYRIESEDCSQLVSRNHRVYTSGGLRFAETLPKQTEVVCVPDMSQYIRDIPGGDTQEAGDSRYVLHSQLSAESPHIGTTRQRQAYTTSLATVSTEHYDGIIYCPTVSTGLFFARRNGKAFITGNSGFPKAGNVGKLADKRLGNAYESTYKPNDLNKVYGNKLGGGITDTSFEPKSAEAKALDGSYTGFQPKPAVEVCIVAMKPLSEKTYVDQALKNGKGITWLDDCRVPTDVKPQSVKAHYSERVTTITNSQTPPAYNPDDRGRFPANLLVSDQALNGHSKYFDLDAWADTLPFLAVPKASKSEKNKGLEGFEVKQSTGGGGGIGDYKNDVNSASGKYGSEKAPAKNHHPTVKPIRLMSYLITLFSRESDTVLDPFMGSGSTGVAAKKLNRDFIGIELDEEYFEIAKKRIEEADK